MQGQDNGFYNINDFVECLNGGCEVEFQYEGKSYWITHNKKGIIVYEAYNEASEKQYKNSVDALGYPFGEKCLSDVFFDVKIISRSF